MALFCLAPEGLQDIGITICVPVTCGVRKMLKFLNGSFCHHPSSLMDMVTKITYFGRMEAKIARFRWPIVDGPPTAPVGKLN